MRLGQIKRNLGIEPSKVVAFLESKNVTISKHPNSKVTGEQLAWIMNEFKPVPVEKEEVIISKEEKPKTNLPTEKEEKKPSPKKKKEEPGLGEIIGLPKESTKKR